MKTTFSDLLATKNGRLAAFFLLYMTEGIPLGFTAVAIATQMRRQGLGPAAIGAFVGSLYLPWAFKWAVGPFVDVLSSDRFGRRRLWILLTQCGMMATLLIAMPFDFVTQLGIFTAIIYAHNAFGATQDVAIDALACGVLPENERGITNGFMFAGAGIGQAVGGSGVLFLASVIPFNLSYFLVIGMILAVTVFVVLPLKEKAVPRQQFAGSKGEAVAAELQVFVRDAWRAFTGTRSAMVGVVVALLPPGAMALGLALQTNLGVELGLSDVEIGWVNLSTQVVFAITCIGGGWLSDRFGRRLTLTLFIIGTTLPTLWLAWAMNDASWIMPVDAKMANRPVPPQSLVFVYWAAVIIYSVCQGGYYGVRTALFMDVTTPAVAATQFTAYMALSNLAISYSAYWQGMAVEKWGYPTTLVLDCALGLVLLVLLPLMKPVPRDEQAPDKAVEAAA